MNAADPAEIVGLVLATLAGTAWWARRRFQETQRRVLRAIQSLSDNLIASESPAEIAEKLVDVLPAITRASGVRVYLFNGSTNSLEYVPTDEDPEPMAIAVDSESEGLANAVVKCFATRAPLNIADVRRNPLVSAGWKPGRERSAVFVPITIKNECLGVIEAASTDRVGYFSPEEQAALQQAANQVAAALKLQQQLAIREQLFRSEKLAATGQLISGVASELSTPLEQIMQLSATLAEDRGCAGRQSELRRLAQESRRASEIVTRLVSFTRPEELSAQPMDVSQILGELVQLREPQWKARGLRVQNRVSAEPMAVLGSRTQIEQVFLSLLVHAEQGAGDSSGRTLSVASGNIGGKLVAEIRFSSDAPSAGVMRASAAATGQAGAAAANVNAPGAGPVSASSPAGLDVCRNIVRNHGGEIRIVSRNGAPDFEHGSVGFEIVLPLAGGDEARPAPTARKTSRSMTLMVVEPDAVSQRQMVQLLGARGHRAVPVPAEQAPDLAHRLRFDAVLWSFRPGGTKWSDYQELMQPALDCFILVSDTYDPELASGLANRGVLLLSRPIRETDLDEVLEAVEARVARV